MPANYSNNYSTVATTTKDNVDVTEPTQRLAEMPKAKEDNKEVTTSLAEKKQIDVNFEFGRADIGVNKLVEIPLTPKGPSAEVKATANITEKKEETNVIPPIEQKISENKELKIEEKVSEQKQIEEKVPEIKVETKAPEDPKIMEHEFKVEEIKVNDKKEQEVKVEEVKKEEKKEDKASDVAKDMKFVASLIGPAGSTDQST